MCRILNGCPVCGFASSLALALVILIGLVGIFVGVVETAAVPMVSVKPVVFIVDAVLVVTAEHFHIRLSPIRPSQP